jgi:C4-dicarboxylate-specific signal transduction histidine kinase
MDARDLLSEEDLLQLISLREVVSGFAHEIAQPLNAIMIASQVLQLRVQRSFLSEDEKSFLVNRLDIMSSQVQRATEIVETLRAFCNPRILPAGSVSIKEAFETVHGLMGQQFTGRGMELVWEHGDPLPPVGADPYAVEFLLVQGLSFARDSVEAAAEWHTQNGLHYRKFVSVKLMPANGGSAALITWNNGQVPEQVLVLDPTTNVGLAAAESILASIGGSLSTSPSSLLMRVP